MDKITAEELREILHYDPETGIFVWRARENVRGPKVIKLVGQRAGAPNSESYINIKITGRSYKAHRLAWLYITGKWPKQHLDHINRDRADNRFSNLREATEQQNSCNRAKSQNSKSGFKGVSLFRNGKWQAQIGVKRKKIFLGYFDRAEDAHAAYCEAAKKAFGEFARLG